ncbi:hypothetical protein TNCV_218281 [Trichonephila clavipes]|nr:hypothetical protein TNCV_218281 [Trichonephila clavipes]
MPNRLTPEQIEMRLGTCGDLIDMAGEDRNFLNNIVTSDESWIPKANVKIWSGEVRRRLKKQAPADFFLCPSLKSDLKGKRFTDITNIQSNVTAELKAIPKELFYRSFQDLYAR